MAAGTHDPPGVAMRPEVWSQPGSAPPADPDHPGAFTRADLLVTLAVLAALVVLRLPSLANSRRCGNATVCLNNHQQLTRAWRTFAEDNNDNLTGNLDVGAQWATNSNRSWCVGWLDYTGGLPSGANTNTLYLLGAQLGPYTRTATLYRCPEDTSLSQGLTGEPRVRSVSMNGYLGERAAPYTSGYRQFKKLTEITAPLPPQTFVFIDEREDSINDACLQIDMTGFDPPQATARRIVDFPGFAHGGGAAVSFADGHSEIKTWLDPRTVPPPRPGELQPLNLASPNNPDVRWLQEHASSHIPR